MDEIEYKLKTNNSVLVVNAIDKLISTIKSKYKPGERQKFVLENEELKFLRDKCSAVEPRVSLTACQGLLALVELGVLEIGHTMSTVITLLPSAHSIIHSNYSAIISTMAGLLILDLKSRLVPGQPYSCQFSLRSPQHPFITVLEKNKGAEDDVFAQMHALCTHPDYIVSSNSLELLRPVFLWLACAHAADAARPWRLLLSLPQSSSQQQLLIAALSCQQICNPEQVERAFTAYSVVTDTAIHQRDCERVAAFLPMLARISHQLIVCGRDPRACYSLMERCFALDAGALRAVAGLALSLLAENLGASCALYLHELLNLCLNIISKYEHSSLSLNIFASLSLQWLQMPSYLTFSALKVASKILDTYEQNQKEDNYLYLPNLRSNKIFQTLLDTDSHLSIVFKLHQTYERIRDEPAKLRSWLESMGEVDNVMKLELLPFLIGITMEKRKDVWFQEVAMKALRIVIGLVNTERAVSVQLLPILLYKIANDPSPRVKLECHRALPLMAQTKENVPLIVSILNKIKANKGAPTSFLILLYTQLAETQVRCFPYLQEVLLDAVEGRPDDLRWETDVARALAVLRICELRPSTHGLELVSTISSILNKCSDKAGAVPTCVALHALLRLWRGAAVAPPSTWRALEPRLGRDSRPTVQISICKLLAEIPPLRLSTPEYDKLVVDAARRLWGYVAESNDPRVVEAACDALAEYRLEDYTLKDVPEIYRRTVKLPPSYCKTPSDAARRPEDVLDYVPCEVWPEVFKYTNQAALPGVQRLTTKLIEREVQGYRSGIYHQSSAQAEPQSASYLPAASVVRGLLECFRKQATSPSYDFPDALLLALLAPLSAELPRPLPPLDLSCLHEVFHRGAQWRPACVKLAARQAQAAASARRFLDNYLRGVANGECDESDVLLVFELLPILCRGVPPNTLRPILERYLGESYAVIEGVKADPNTDSIDPESYSFDSKRDSFDPKRVSVGPKRESVDPKRESTDLKGDSVDRKTGFLFIYQLEMIKLCLECEKIHAANRTLLSQLIETYFSVIPDDNVAWPAYVRACTALCTKYLERMTSPSGWWEVSAGLLRKCGALRCAVAASGACVAPLAWLSELVDAQATQLTEQEYSLRCMVPALRAARKDDAATIDWFLQLMARTQVAFKETEDLSAKLYLCDVFMLSAAVLSGLWALRPEPAAAACSREAMRALLPPALAALLRGPWDKCASQTLEWLCHTRGALDEPTAACCQRALLALRHTEPFVARSMWTRLENYFGKSTADAEDHII